MCVINDFCTLANFLRGSLYPGTESPIETRDRVVPENTDRYLPRSLVLRICTRRKMKQIVRLHAILWTFVCSVAIISCHLYEVGGRKLRSLLP
jgi:hypothetical protein